MSTESRRRSVRLVTIISLVVGAWLGLGAVSGAAFASQGNGNANGSANSNGNGQAQAPGQLKKQDAPSTTSTATSTSTTPSSSSSATAPTAPPATSGTSGVLTQPQPLSNADLNPGGANNGGDCGAYCSTRDGSPSLNGNGNGKAVGKPCAGCVGKADNKNPKGQRPNGSDHNNGYECDGNNGIGKTNPAHTGCKTTPTPCTVTNTCGGGTDCTATNTCPGGSDCTVTHTCPSGGDCTVTHTCPPPSPGCQPSPANHFCSTVGARPPGHRTTVTPTVAPPHVLGEKLTRTPNPTSPLPTSVSPNVLPFTGLDVAPLLGMGSLLLLLGAALLRIARPRARTALTG